MAIAEYDLDAVELDAVPADDELEAHELAFVLAGVDRVAAVQEAGMPVAEPYPFASANALRENT